MREILFRGKRLDNGEWVLSGNIIRFIPENGEDLIFIQALSEPCTCYHDEKDNIIAFEKGIFYKVDTKTVGQYTGLKDKNGKKIFDGDIVKMIGDKCVVKWTEEDAKFIIIGSMTKLDFPLFFSEHLEVIGNIHDNKSLLNNQEDGE